jgi:hypothetical protein
MGRASAVTRAMRRAVAVFDGRDGRAVIASLSLWVALQLAVRLAAGQQSRSVTGRIRPVTATGPDAPHDWISKCGLFILSFNINILRCVSS